MPVNPGFGFSPPHQSEEDIIADYNAQSLDPNSTIIKAYRDAFFRNKPSEINERLAMVLTVRSDIKIPSDLVYFNNKEVAAEFDINGVNRSWVCAICRIFDFHAGIPNPSLEKPTTATGMSIKDLTLIRCNVGKFYASSEEVKSRGIPTLEPGDWIIVEFQDKSTMSNGTIKDLYLKRPSGN